VPLICICIMRRSAFSLRLPLLLRNASNLVCLACLPLLHGDGEPMTCCACVLQMLCCRTIPQCSWAELALSTEVCIIMEVVTGK
jgi:hypothetical protein